MGLSTLGSPPSPPTRCRYLGISSTGGNHAAVRALEGQERPANSSEGDATKELSYQDRDAARSTTSRTEKPARFSSKVTLLRSFLTQIETLIPLLLRYQGTSRTTEVTSLFPPHLRGTPARPSSSKVTLQGLPAPQKLRRCSLHTLEGRQLAFSHLEARQSLQRGGALRELLPAR